MNPASGGIVCAWPARFVVIAVIIAGALAPGCTPRPPAARFRGRPPTGPGAAAEAGSAAPDGYAPIPQWAGQTRAPRPARSEAYAVETVASGLDRRLLVPLPARRPNHRQRAPGPHPHRRQGRQAVGAARRAARDLRTADRKGCSRCCRIATSRGTASLYFDYTALPEGTDPASAPRLAGVLHGGAGPALGRSTRASRT